MKYQINVCPFCGNKDLIYGTEVYRCRITVCPKCHIVIYDYDAYIPADDLLKELNSTDDEDYEELKNERKTEALPVLR